MRIKKYQNSGVITRDQVHKPTQYESDMAKKGYIRFRDQKGRLYNYVPEGYSIINNSGKQVEEKDTDYNYGYNLPELVVERPVYTQHEKEVAEYARNNPNTSTIKGIDQSKWEDQRGLFGNIRDALNVTDSRNNNSQPLYKRLADKLLWELDSHNPSGGLEGVVSNPGMIILGATSSEPIQLLKFLGSGTVINNLTTPFTGKTIGQYLGDVTPIVTGTTGDVIATTVGGGIGSSLINSVKPNKLYKDYNIQNSSNSDASNINNNETFDLGELIGSVREGLQKTREYYHSPEFMNRLRKAGFSEDEVYRTISEIEKVQKMGQENYGIHIQDNLKDLNERGVSLHHINADSEGNIVYNKYNEPIYKGSTTIVNKNNTPDINQLVNTLLHEYAGHTSTAGANPAYPSFGTNEIIHIRSQFPMITKMMNYNNNLVLRHKPIIAENKKLINLNDLDLSRVLEARKPSVNPVKRVEDFRRNGKFIFEYLDKPQEIRARFIEELLTGRPNQNKNPYLPMDWDAYLQQALKKGGKLLPKNKNNMDKPINVTGYNTGNTKISVKEAIDKGYITSNDLKDSFPAIIYSEGVIPENSDF